MPVNVMDYLREQVVKVRDEERRVLSEAQAGMDKFLDKLGKHQASKQEVDPKCVEGDFGLYP